jgi:integrase
MSDKYRMYLRKNGVFYAEDVQTHQQGSLGTRDRSEAERLLFAKNESARDGLVSREVGMAYLAGADAGAKTRTWQWALDQMVDTKAGETRKRWETARKDPAFNSLKDVVLVDTRAEHFLTVFRQGTVSTNFFLRRVHNFALDLGWLARPVIVRRQWPKVKHGKKRAITWSEHQLLLEHERDPEIRDYLELLWHSGASQGDAAQLKAEDLDWTGQTLRFFRGKTGSTSFLRFGPDTAAVLKRRPAAGLLFPRLAQIGSSARACAFHRRCVTLGFGGITLHSYRYAWAQRAKKGGFPERYAMMALGQSSKAVHEAYAGTSLDFHGIEFG